MTTAVAVTEPTGHSDSSQSVGTAGFHRSLTWLSCAEVICAARPVKKLAVTPETVNPLVAFELFSESPSDFGVCSSMGAVAPSTYSCVATVPAGTFASQTPPPVAALCQPVTCAAPLSTG